MKTLSRESIKRMWPGASGNGAGGGGGDLDLTGYASQLWVNQNYVSIDFFKRLFTAWGPAETSGDPDVEVEPNDVESTISNIKAMFGLWTEQYLSALGQGSGGGGGGGGVTLNQPISAINSAGLGAPVTAGSALVWYGGEWTYSPSARLQVAGLNSSAAMSVTGSVTATSFVKSGGTSSQFLKADGSVDSTVYASQDWVNQNFITIAFFETLFNAVNSQGVKVGANTTTGIDSIKAMFGFWTNQYLSALGQGSGGGGGVTLNQPLAGINNAGLSAPSAAGLGLVYNGSSWVYTNAASMSVYGLTVSNSLQAYNATFGSTVYGAAYTATAGGFSVSGKDDTYVLLAGGGTKALSEIGGGGAVNSITLGQGGTNYTPDSSGIVTLPPYPSGTVTGVSYNGGNPVSPISGVVSLGGLCVTVKVGSTDYGVSSSGVISLPAYPSTSGLVSSVVIGASGTPISPVNGVVTLPAYPSKTSDLTNDSGFITGYTDTKNTAGSTNKVNTKMYLVGAESQGANPQTYSNESCYIGTDNCLYSGGSKVMTSASGYLPLSGGTMSGVIYFNSNVGGDLGVDSVGIYIESGSHFLRVNKAQGRGEFDGYTLLHSNNYSSYALPLAGGTITGLSGTPLLIDTTHNYKDSYITFKHNGLAIAWCGYGRNLATFLQSAATGNPAIGILDDGTPYYSPDSGTTKYTLIHTGNLSGQYLPSTGGTINGNLSFGDTPLTIKVAGSTGCYILYQNNTAILGYIGFDTAKHAIIYEGNSNWYYAIHSGNYTTYFTDTKNTVGNADVYASSGAPQLYLVGTVSYGGSGSYAQSSVNRVCYIGSDNCLYSNGTKVITQGESIDRVKSLGNYAYSALASGVPVNNMSYKIITSGGTDLGDSQYEVLHLAWDSGDWGNYLIFGANNGRVGVKYKSTGAVREIITSDGGTLNGSLTINNNLSCKGLSITTGSGTSGGASIAGGVSIASNLTVGQSSVNTSYTLLIDGSCRINNLSVGSETTVQSTSCATLETHSSRGVYVKTGTAPNYVDGSWSNASDMRLKDIVSNVGASIDQIANAPVFNFRWKAGGTQVMVGTSAQYWQKILPNTVTEAIEGYLYMDYAAAAIAAVIITARTVRDHETRIRILEQENAELRNEINRLKNYGK